MRRTAEERRTHPVGDASWYSEAEALGRVVQRVQDYEGGLDLSVDQSLVIKLVLGQFQNVTVQAGCIKRGKVRWDRLHVNVYLIRRFTGVPPRELAGQLKMSPRYLRFALERGRKLLEAAEHDGRLDDAVDQLRRLEAEWMDGDHP